MRIGFKIGKREMNFPKHREEIMLNCNKKTIKVCNYHMYIYAIYKNKNVNKRYQYRSI
jgi:uncharacterized protein YqhQ